MTGWIWLTFPLSSACVPSVSYLDQKAVYSILQDIGAMAMLRNTPDTSIMLSPNQLTAPFVRIEHASRFGPWEDTL